MKTNPYLFFNGNCEEALSFYGKTLGTKPEFMESQRLTGRGALPAGLEGQDPPRSPADRRTQCDHGFGRSRL